MGSLKLPLLCLCLCLSLSLLGSATATGGNDIHYKCSASNKTTAMDKNLLGVALNLEYFEAEYFLWAAYGYGLDALAKYLVDGGPAPLGAQKANLDPYYTDLYKQMGLQEIGHIRIIKKTLGDAPKCAFPRTLLDLTKKNWADAFDKAFLAYNGKKLSPPFDPYEDSLKYLISTYFIPYVGLTGYEGASPLLTGYNGKKLVASLLGVEAGQDAVIRTEMYRQKDKVVAPYKYTVADFSNAISMLRNDLTGNFVDEGLVVPIKYGAEMMITGNVLSADNNSVSYARTGEQVLQVVYGTGDASKPGGFYPKGGQGVIAAGYLGDD